MSKVPAQSEKLRDEMFNVCRRILEDNGNVAVEKPNDYTMNVSVWLNSHVMNYQLEWYENLRIVVYPYTENGDYVEYQNAMFTLWTTLEVIRWSNAICDLVNTRSRRPCPY